MSGTEYYFSDFTEENYRKLLSLAKAHGEFCGYDDFFENRISKPVIWRHDIDFSIQRAYKLAQIEYEENVKSTYFVHFNSNFYNVFEEENIDKINGILSMGHEIGLHFDCTVYIDLTNEELVEELDFYKKMMNHLFKRQIKAFSFHNPTTNLLNHFKDTQYAGVYNAYAERIMKELVYCSDSNGYWRYQRLEDFLKKEQNGICVLTHPGWWTPDILSPRQRIQRAIDGRKTATEERYERDLSEAGRVNVK